MVDYISHIHVNGGENDNVKPQTVLFALLEQQNAGSLYVYL